MIFEQYMSIRKRKTFREQDMNMKIYNVSSDQM